jgi:SAM-dependent methyltransferase
MIKQLIKKIVYQTNTQHVLDKFVFIKEKIKNIAANKLFLKNNPNFVLPSDYFLYETYQLNYQQYKDDGLLSAQEIIDWAKPYINLQNSTVLEWGCGVSRIIRHLPELLPSSKFFGADINAEMIKWNKQFIPVINFDLINYYPPTQYMPNTFEYIYAISVFTHIEDTQQENWLKEAHRILATNGIFLFTTHGKKYFTHLDNTENKALQANGVFTKSYKQKGHRMMTTYNHPKVFTQLIQKYFDVLEYHDGNINPNKIGGQDLWIVKKKN